MGELIIGDRQTGKTAVATDTILNQKGKDVLCLCSNWSKSSNSSTNCKYIGRSWFNGLPIIVAANADAPATLQYLAPYTGATLAEYFMYNGKHTLVIYDDLSKQAQAYRQMSLL